MERLQKKNNWRLWGTWQIAGKPYSMYQENFEGTRFICISQSSETECSKKSEDFCILISYYKHSACPYFYKTISTQSKRHFFMSAPLKDTYDGTRQTSFTFLRDIKI